jgi:iron complex transport system substrate-binding protein
MVRHDRFRVFILIAAFMSGSVALAGAEQSIVTHALGFTVAYRDGAKYVTVAKPWAGAGQRFSYVLYPRGTRKPTGPAGSRFIEIPVRRAVAFSTSYLASIDAIGESRSLVGVDNGAYVNTPSIRARIASGSVRNIAKNGMADIETLIALDVDAIFTFGMGNEWDTYPKMDEAGLPVVMNGDWNEQDPLGRAEWIKFIALFYDREKEANAFFSKTEAEYSRLASLASTAASRPRILVSAPYQGTWAVAGGASYMARFIRDAGGAYLWASDSATGSLVLPVEAVYAAGQAADIWLDPGSALSLAEVRAMDSRFASLPAFVKGAVYNNNARVNPSGANDYFESGAIRPDLVLRDLVSLFHPELVAGPSGVYYQRLR